MYYLLLTTGNRDGQEYPVYFQYVNEGYLLQGNIYDANKYTSDAVASDKIKEMESLNLFNDYPKFVIVPVDKRVFGNTPRNVI